MALTTVSSDRLSTNVKNTNFTAAEKQDLTNDILPLSGQIGNRNKIINGEFRVNQRQHTGSAGHNAYTLDRWKYARSANTEFSQDQSTVTPDGFANSVKMTSIGSNGSTGASDYAYWRYFIEGQDLQDLSKGTSAAKAFTLSFYFKSDVTGTFAISILDANSRMCNANYTVSNTNWNRYTITIPADTTGTIANTNASGLEINFWIVAGSNYTSGSAVHTWGALSNSSLATGFNAHITSNGVNLYLTGVQLEVGSVATEFEHEPFGTTLRKCLRYFFAHSGGNPGVNGSTPNTNPDTNVGTASCQSTSSISYNTFLPVPMRVVPSVYSTVTGSTRYRLNSAGANTNSGSDITINTVLSTHSMASGDLGGFSGLSAGQAGNVRRYSGSGILGFSAEL